jgi:putative endonuclease
MGIHTNQQAKWHPLHRGGRDLARRVWQHREAPVAGFTQRYGLKRLVWCEYHETIIGAIQREKTIKHWPRAWKVRLIHANNPNWNDLYETINQQIADGRDKPGHDE